ncbi:hypothetical protein AYJ54_20065 [Bradyrhizobium centrolobii]|uniref:Uncharacterized protein n=1 Tax=Bradyrhizobium centrolobii TaxID=1505087 RepID=A0A176YIS5_9BRAD|nr:hypothetical protein [Bradyrhizobium centrolobii]OAF06218.1 hypothetical protein AYJ54_20065 [Bradyrhizobium centrolobii]
MFLLAMVTLCCAVVAGTIALFEPVSGQMPDQRVAASEPIDMAAQPPVRVVGAPFAPNINPRER